MSHKPFPEAVGVEPQVYGYVNRVATWIVKVTEHPTRVYTVRLADLRKEGYAGVSVGGGVIYIDSGLASQAYVFAQNNPGKMQSQLPMVLAHEIAHDLAGHAATLQNIGVGTSVVGNIGKVLSHVPGPAGWAGVALAWGATAASIGTFAYARDQELEADRKAISYWIALELPCELWVQRFQTLADKGIQGDFRHPTEGRLEQARELCGMPAPPSSEPPNFGTR